MITSFVSSVLIPLRDFIYPPLCWVCDRRLDDGNLRVCRECWSSFTPFREGEPVWHEFRERFDKESFVDDFISCFYFEKEGTFQHVIHLLKYRGMKSMGVMLGREIGERILQTELMRSTDVLIPIPLHRLKERERGYNQSDLLCRGITEVTRIPSRKEILRRVKYTQSQTLLTMEERQTNVGDAFEVVSRFVRDVDGKSIMLVDDVMTTGSTINACARVLKQQGAKRVFAASAAVAK